MNLVDLQKIFKENANPEKAEQMSAYMRNLFVFHGLMKARRVELSRDFVKETLKQDSGKIKETIELLWQLPEREYQYVALELIEKSHRKWDDSFLKLFVKLVEKKSWWDTVDALASNAIGKYLLQNPGKIDVNFAKWNKSKNMWLNRVAIIFQLKFRDKTRLDLLEQSILTHAASGEFFHQKAIGWALRQYSYTSKKWVRDFVGKNVLQPLSKREALKAVNRSEN